MDSTANFGFSRGRLNPRGTRTRLPRPAGRARPARRRHEPLPTGHGGDAAREPPACRQPPCRRSARAWQRWRQRVPRGVPPHPRPRQELEARVASSVSRSAKRTTSSTSPTTKRQRAQVNGGGAECRRPGAQRPRLRRRARSARPGRLLPPSATLRNNKQA